MGGVSDEDSTAREEADLSLIKQWIAIALVIGVAHVSDGTKCRISLLTMIKIPQPGIRLILFALSHCAMLSVLMCRHPIHGSVAGALDSRVEDSSKHKE